MNLWPGDPSFVLCDIRGAHDGLRSKWGLSDGPVSRCYAGLAVVAPNERSYHIEL